MRQTTMDDKDLDIDNVIRKVMHHKLKNYISGVINSQILHHHTKINTKKLKEDEAPTNAMGTSSSTSGTGPIDTFDPLLKLKIARRKKPAELPIA
jgi:hypothetical protein